jgi:hypothetical protein
MPSALRLSNLWVPLEANRFDSDPRLQVFSCLLALDRLTHSYFRFDRESNRYPKVNSHWS